MLKSVNILCRIDRLEQNAVSLEIQGLQIDHKLQNDKAEISRLNAFKRQQQQDLKITKKIIAIKVTKLKELEAIKLTNTYATNNVR
jgi:hypothetical protein